MGVCCVRDRKLAENEGREIVWANEQMRCLEREEKRKPRGFGKSKDEKIETQEGGKRQEEMKRCAGTGKGGDY